MAEHDKNQEILDQVRALIRERKLDRRKLMQTAAALGVSATPVVGAAFAAVKPSAVSAQSSDLKLVTVSQEQQATWIKNFNPWLTGDNVRWPTHAGIYEPMLIYNEITGETHPWLATAWEFSADNLSLTFTLQEGVTWSDGEVLDSADVKFTFEYLQAHEDLPSTGAVRGALGFVDSIEAPDAATVVFHFNEVFTPILWDLGEAMICPEHIWSTVEDPATSTNEEPVGSGPFTVIGEFQPQYWEIHKNPTYWQEGQPAVDGFRFPSYPTNDAANLATLNGENDWAGNFIPDVENTFVAKDPEHNVWWFPPIGGTVMLYAQTEVAPFDQVEVRKAMSMAIDRPQIVEVAMYNYTRPADATGLSDAYPSWFDQGVADAGAAWVTRDVDAANAALDAAGLVLDGDVRALSDGTKMEYELLVVTGWSDWVSSVQIISQNLEEIGIKATVTPMDFAAWIEKVQKGDFTLSIGWTSSGPTPLNFYRGIMSSKSYNPVGQLSNENWARYQNADADAAIDALAATSDPEEQHAAGVQLQQLFSDNAPCIPLFPGPEWGEFVTTRFTGFPSADNPYGQLPTWELPARLRVMTTITPV